MTDEAQQTERTVVCDACEVVYDKKVIIGANNDGTDFIEPPEAGWYLPFVQFGYYGGFDDRMFSGDADKDWWLCHDCIVKFLEAFPMLAKKVGVGGHYNTNHTGEHEDGTVHEPCCRWAWTSRPCEGKAFEAFVVGEDGKWKSSD